MGPARRSGLDAALRLILACLLSVHWAIAAAPASLRSAGLAAAEASKSVPQSPRQAEWLAAGKQALKTTERQSWSGGDALLPARVSVSADGKAEMAPPSAGFAIEAAAVFSYRSRAPPAAA